MPEVCDLAGNRRCGTTPATYIRGLMSSQDPFGRPPGGGLPPYLQGNRGHRRRVFGGAALAGFLLFDLIVVLIVGALFFTGVFGGGDDSETVIIPPAAGQVAGVAAADDDDDDDGVTSVVTKESGTTTIVTPDDDAGDPATAGPAPVGANASSMIREANLRPSLDTLKELAPGKVLMLSLHPTHVSAQVLTPQGKVKNVVDHWNMPAQVMSVTDGSGDRETVSWSSIDPAAPERLVKASGAADANVSHLVVMPVFSPWALHLKRGKHIQADEKGKPLS